MSFCAGEVRRRLCDEVTVTTRNFSRDPEDPSGIVCAWVWADGYEGVWSVCMGVVYRMCEGVWGVCMGVGV